VEKAILHALAMHPNERPPSVAAFKTELLGQDTLQPVPAVEQPAWRKALVTNRPLVLACIVLLALACLVTMFAPPLPQPSATPTPRPVATLVSPARTP
jgi:hypothetical protein